MIKRNKKSEIAHRRLSAREHLNRGCDYDAEGKVKEAFSEFLEAGRLGSPEAQLNLGNMYSSGNLGFVDKRRAIYHYKKSIGQGYSAAAMNLAITYKEFGQQRWYIFWLRRAASLGNEDAIEELKKSM